MLPVKEVLTIHGSDYNDNIIQKSKTFFKTYNYFIVHNFLSHNANNVEFTFHKILVYTSCYQNAI